MQKQLKEIPEIEFSELIPKLKLYIRKFINDEDSINDILQETLITAIYKLIELQEPFNITGWMKTIARNKCLNFLKKKGKMVGYANIPEKYLYHFYEQDETEYKNEKQLIDSLGNLPHSEKYILQMKYFTHHSIKEISKLFKIPEGTVKRRLFDARQKLKKEMEMKEQGERDKGQVAPEIKIFPKKESKKNSVKILGYGLNFGSPLAGVGDVEVYEAYEYPGRIFKRKAVSKVTRNAKMFGREVLEVIDDSISLKLKMKKHFYYTYDEHKISMVFRIFDFPKELIIHFDQKDLMKPLELDIQVGEFVGNRKENEIGIVDIVDVKIGEKEYLDVIRKRFSCDDYPRRCYMEHFYSSEGREILHRNYIGENWEMGGVVTWEKWKDAPEIEFKGEKFRLWFAFVLTDRYKEK